MASLKKSTRKNPNVPLSSFELKELHKRCQYVPEAHTSESPPQLTGGESTEANIHVRHGVNGLTTVFFPSSGQALVANSTVSPETQAHEQESQETVKIVLTDSGKIKIIPKRRGYGGKSAFVDWLNYTFHESTLSRAGHLVTDEELILHYSEKLERILGYSITAVNPSGRHFYQKSYVLGDNFGLVCYGGQRNTLLTSISGEGLAAAKPGWEKRLHDFLTEIAVSPKLTRVDVAHDDYNGDHYSVDQAKYEFETGLYNNGGRTPDCEQRGNWYRPNGKGRTFYVGHRINGKYARIYEKGKQLGDKESSWCRVEVEFKSVDRVMPFDILLNPGESLAAAYPAFGWISEEQSVIRTIQKTTEISYEAMCNWLIRQCGSALAVVAEIEGSVQNAFDKVGIFKKVPPRLHIPSHENSPIPLHKRMADRLKPARVLDELTDFFIPDEPYTGHAFE
ncbi:MAG: replication initiation factor domain-containing protein [Sulfuricellaceae bacterium]